MQRIRILTWSSAGVLALLGSLQWVQLPKPNPAQADSRAEPEVRASPAAVPLAATAKPHPVEELAGVAPTDARAQENSAPASPPADAEYELDDELSELLRAYRDASEPAEQEYHLLSLSMSDDPEVLRVLLNELDFADAERASLALAAVDNYGSREAVPTLRRLAQRAATPSLQQEFLDSAEFLDLPTFDEFQELLEREELTILSRP